MNSRGYGCEEWKHEHECERCRERKIWMGMRMELMEWVMGIGVQSNRNNGNGREENGYSCG